MTVIDFEVGKQAIVQIYHAESSEIAGTGFWLGGRYLMTCAHVVGKILRSPDYQNLVGQSVDLAFDEAGQSQKLEAKVIYCRYDAREGREDVAVLQLAENIDLKTADIQLATRLQQSRGSKVSTYGYIYGNEVGRNITAVTNGSAKSWIQIEVSQDVGIPITEGLSGSPVWCHQSQMFVGMVVARDELCPEARVGFMVPATELLTPCQFVQRQKLLDILEPYEQRLCDQLIAAYQLCRNRHAIERSHYRLERILEDLGTQGAGSQDASNKLVQFAASLLNVLDGTEFEGLVVELTRWADTSKADLNALKDRMRVEALNRQSQVIAPQKPVLLVSVCAESIEGTPPFFIEAWLILDPEKYDPLTGKGVKSLSLKGFESNELAELYLIKRGPTEGIEYKHFPLLLAAYLNQICRRGFICTEGIDLNDLTIELFLPFALMNQPLERLGLPDLGFVEPLGIDDLDRPQVLLRSQDRLEQPRSHSRWQKRWDQAAQNQQTPATELLVADRKTLKRDLKDERVLGIKLKTSPTATNSGEIARLVISGAPVAIWIRDNPSAEALFQLLEQNVLAHPLQEFQRRVLALRRDTCGLNTDADYATSAELGHHLAVLWENPKHVPPSYRYSASKL